MPGCGKCSKRKMKRAGIYNPYWDSLGGGEKYTANVVKLLLDLGWTVDVWWKEDISDKLHQRFGLDVAAANFISQKPTSEYDLLFWVSDGSLPVSLAKKTIIHFQFPFANVAGRNLPNRLKSSFYTFVVNSKFTKRFIDAEFGVDSQVVYPPIDVGFFSPGPKTNTILYVGRFSQLTQQKGQLYLVEAFAKLEQKLGGWRLVLAGNTDVGTEVEYLATLSKSAVGHAVEIVTNPNIGRLRDLYSQAKFFWSAAGYGFDPEQDPLKVEHFGMTVVEAMASGCVPIVSALGGHLEIVTNGETGYLWSTPDEMIKYTLDLVGDAKKWQKLSQAALVSSNRFSTGEFRLKFTQLL